MCFSSWKKLMGSLEMLSQPTFLRFSQPTFKGLHVSDCRGPKSEATLVFCAYVRARVFTVATWKWKDDRFSLVHDGRYGVSRHLSQVSNRHMKTYEISY